MSRENIEIVRRFVLLGFDEAREYADPDIVWNPIEEAPSKGHDAVRAYLDRWEDEWEEYEGVPEEFLDADDRVLVTFRVNARGRGSGMKLEAHFYAVYTLRGGKIVRYDDFTQRSAALEAAGLRSKG
jgi:ketosteroid isomerase-like protein